jgi:hypothetical protein
VEKILFKIFIFSKFNPYREVMITFTLQASDEDLPPNSDLTYAITGGDSWGNFSVDAVTGKLSVRGPLDYEALEPGLGGRLALTVTVTDGGTPPLSAQLTLNVQLKVGGQGQECVCGGRGEGVVVEIQGPVSLKHLGGKIYPKLV